MLLKIITASHNLSTRLPALIISASGYLALILSFITIMVGVIRFAFLVFPAQGSLAIAEGAVAALTGFLLSLLIDGQITACCSRLLKAMESNKLNTSQFLKVPNPDNISIIIYRQKRLNAQVNAWANALGILIFSGISAKIGEIAWAAIWQKAGQTEYNALILSVVVSLVLVYSELNRATNTTIILDGMKMPLSYQAAKDAQLKKIAIDTNSRNKGEVVSLQGRLPRRDKLVRLNEFRQKRRGGLSVPQAAKELGIDKATAYRYEQEPEQQESKE